MPLLIRSSPTFAPRAIHSQSIVVVSSYPLPQISQLTPGQATFSPPPQGMNPNLLKQRQVFMQVVCQRDFFFLVDQWAYSPTLFRSRLPSARRLSCLPPLPRAPPLPPPLQPRSPPQVLE